MKLIVAGSRTINSLDSVMKCLRVVMELIDVTEIISGAAPGVDTLGEEAAGVLGIGTRRFPARWNRPNGSFDPSAGFKRNVDMANYSDALLAIWDGKSSGTKHMIETMKKLDKRIFVFTPKLNPRNAETQRKR